MIRRYKSICDKYDHKSVCFNCVWSEEDEMGRLYCTNTVARDFSEFVPYAYVCERYRERKGKYAII